MASKAGSGCLGWIVAGVLLLLLVGKCMPEAPSGASESSAPRTATAWRYVRPAVANCRADGSAGSVSVDRLERNTFVGVLDTADGWSLVDRTTDCWIRSDLLSDDRVSTPEPVRRFAASGGRAEAAPRSHRSSSTYYANCSAARAAGAAPVYRGEPGYAPRLDRDGDGIGCE